MTNISPKTFSKVFQKKIFISWFLAQISPLYDGATLEKKMPVTVTSEVIRYVSTNKPHNYFLLTVIWFELVGPRLLT